MQKGYCNVVVREEYVRGMGRSLNNAAVMDAQIKRRSKEGHAESMRLSKHAALKHAQTLSYKEYVREAWCKGKGKVMQQ